MKYTNPTIGRWTLLCICAVSVTATGCSTLGTPAKLPTWQRPNTGTTTLAERSPQAGTPVASTSVRQQTPVVTASAEGEPRTQGQAVNASRPVAAQAVGFTAEYATCSSPDCGSPVATEACGCGASCAPPSGPAIRNVQEYVFDGGDQQPTVVIKEDWSAQGVDPTDTVVYYETETGELCVQPTNRVPIYAPRFGAVRQVTGALLSSKAVGTQRILAPVSPGRFDDTDLAGTVMQPVAPLGQQQVKLIDALRERTAGTPLDGVLPPQRMSEALMPFEDIDVLPTGRITDDEIAVMGRIIQNARSWYVPENLGIVIEGQTAHAMIDSTRPQDVHVYEIRGKCALRICKTASHTIANSGDIVNFTIRFDNAGVKPVGNVVLVDSLSPRLEYIEGSQQSSVKVRFAAEPNEVGSQVLRWEIESPIEKNDGGVVSFDCRVR